MNLFLVESPLQLLNAYEAENYFSSKNSLYIIRLSNDIINDKQMTTLIDYYSIRKRSLIITINSNSKGLFDILKIAFLKFYFYVKKKQLEKVFVGNFESGLFSLLIKNIKNGRMILLDDGAKSISIQNKFSDNYNFNFFSFYDLIPFKNQNIYKNDFNKLRKNFHSDNLNKEILLLGSKLSEISIIEEIHYIELIKKISKLYENEKIIYISHRGENINKLEIIEKEINNISIKNLDYPVEFYPINENKAIKKVVSFYSTALFTMSKIYDCEAIAVKFNYENSKYKENIDEVYSFYKNYMKVIEL